MRLTVELYDALIAAGIEDTLAKKAAAAVLSEEDRDNLATKADLAALEVRTIKWTVGTGIGVIAILVAALTLVTGILLRALPS